MSKTIKTLALGALAFSMLAGYLPAAAQTVNQSQIDALMAQIAAAQAQLTALQGNSACPVFARSLTVGSVGSDVMALQQWLNHHGFVVSVSGAGSVGMESSYFGAKTKVALAAFQASKGIVPAVGYFGPITRGAIVAMCVVPNPNPGPNPVPTPTPVPGLQGGAGSVDQYTLIAGINNEQVGEGEKDVKVAGLKIENSDSSDIMITAVKVVFTQGTANHDFRKYADEVSIWLDGKEYARVPATDFTDNNDFTQTISLKDGAIIRANKDGELDIAVSGISNLDSLDASDTWMADFANIRFKDAQGTTIAEDPGTATRTFSFETFATAVNTELKITEGDTAVNDAHIIKVDSGSTKTNNEPILSLNVQVKGDSDVRLDDLPVTVAVTGAASTTDVISGLHLQMDGTEVGSADVVTDCISGCTAASSVFLFENMDLTLKAGKTYKFTVLVDLYGLTGAGNLDAGDTIAATIGETETNLSQFTAEDANGDDLANADVTGSVVGEADAVYNVGFDFKLVSRTASITSPGDPATASSTDIGTYTIVYDLTAFGGDVSIDKDCKNGGTNVVDQGTDYTAENAATPAASSTTGCSVTSTADTNTNDSNAWIVRDGETKRFTLTVAATANDAFVRVYLNSINWDDDVTDTDPDMFYTFGLGQDKTATNSLYLQTYP